MVLELMEEIMEGMIEKEVNFIFTFKFHYNLKVKFPNILKVAFIYLRTKENVKKICSKISSTHEQSLLFSIGKSMIYYTHFHYDLNAEIYFRTWKGKRW